MATPWSIVTALLLLCPDEALGRTVEPGRTFLKENAKKEGVITTDSGLQYKVLKKGEGKHHPADNATCTMHYSGTTLNMTPDFADKDEQEWNCFDSSYEKGEYKYFTQRMVVQGIAEAMSLMVLGSHWEVYVPGNLGYGGTKGGGQDIGYHEMLIFRMEILEIEGDLIKAKCNYKTREFCDANENEILDEWWPKSISEIEKKIKALKKKAAYSNKEDVQKAMAKQQRILREFVKMKKKKIEL